MKNFNSDAVVPFLWVRDEEQSIIEKEIDAIKALSINAFMIESRPRVLAESDFGEQSWYTRVGKILAYARKLNMHVWLLDDRSFPTGSANGKINLKYPHLRAKQLKCVAIDLALKGEPSFVLTGVKDNSDDKIIYACIKGDKDKLELEVEGKESIVKVPALTGFYRAYFLIETTDSPERDGYIDMLNYDSVNVLIKEVYQPHYEQFKEYFGTTFMGYFSDEPRFANGINWYYGTPVSMYDSKMGKINVAYPYSEHVLKKLISLGYSKEDLLNLFIDADDNAYDLRADYMETITDEYSKNFVGQLAKWCKERGVCYSGHVIEDMGVHFNSGCGAGHYFKAMRGADFAGIDVVLHQIKPFYADRKSVSPVEGGVVDGKFFNFTLAKLASSVAVQSATANGKSLCEIFGAYGWGESLSDMLYLVNHMAVRGINHFIPHAFSMNLYDKDCPPYFNGQGKNPSFDGYKVLFEYMAYLSKYSKKSYATVAVFYNAESVWSGKEYLSIDNVAKVLTENQIEFDFIDKDNLVIADNIDDAICINGCKYDYLIIPNGYYTKQTKNIIDSVKSKVIRVGENELSNLKDLLNKSIAFEKASEYLRVKRVKLDEYMLFNESIYDIENAIITDKELYLIDPINKVILSKSDGGKLCFTIKSAQAIFVVEQLPLGYHWKENLIVVKEVCDINVFFKRFDQETKVFVGEKNVSYTPCNNDFDFSGTVIYELSQYSKDEEYLLIDYYGEYVKVNINGNECDFITSPAVIKLCSGENLIKITVCNTLANAMKDTLSAYSSISSCGLKSVKICRKE